MNERPPVLVFLSQLGYLVFIVSLLALIPLIIFHQWKYGVGGIIAGIVIMALGSTDALFRKKK